MKQFFPFILMLCLLFALGIPCMAASTSAFDAYDYDYSTEYTDAGYFSNTDGNTLPAFTFPVDVLAPICEWDMTLQDLQCDRFCVALLQLPSGGAYPDYLFVDYVPQTRIVRISFWNQAVGKNVVFDKNTLPEGSILERISIRMETDAKRGVYQSGTYVTEIHEVRVTAEFYYTVDGAPAMLTLQTPKEIDGISNIGLYETFLGQCTDAYATMITENTYSFASHYRFDKGSANFTIRIKSSAGAVGGGMTGGSTSAADTAQRALGVAMVALLSIGAVGTVVYFRRRSRYAS